MFCGQNQRQNYELLNEQVIITESSGNFTHPVGVFDPTLSLTMASIAYMRKF